MTLIEKIKFLIDKLLTESKIPGAYVPVIRNLITGYLKDAKEADLRLYIKSMQDELIPWLLKEEK